MTDQQQQGWIIVGAISMAMFFISRALAFVAALLLLTAGSVWAHVGSPDVFLEGDAGPYHLFVAVRMPQVIPGIAEIQVRSGSDEVHEIRTFVTTLAGPGSKYGPVPDRAARSPTDPQFFTSSLWLMQNGSLQVRLIVYGARGEAQMAVPIASFAQRTLAMPRWFGAILAVLMLGLAVGAVSIAGAAVREAELASGAAVGAEYHRRGLKAMAIASGIMVAVFYLGDLWWSVDAGYHEITVNFFKPPQIEATLQGNHIILKPADPGWLEHTRTRYLIADHGHLMHLFLIGTPGLAQMWHLHPSPIPDGGFVDDLPSMPPGRYRIFADIVSRSGFPVTMVGDIVLPAISGKPLSGDDSGGSVAPMGAGSAYSNVFVLPDGGRVMWQRDKQTMRADTPGLLRFVVQDETGKAAADLEPYMGMAAHAAIVRSDFSVFAHIHPSGSVPMASLMMASGQTYDTSVPMPMKMPSERISPEISLPYGFPKPGLYRIFLQFKRQRRVETAIFDSQVR